MRSLLALTIFALGFNIVVPGKEAAPPVGGYLDAIDDTGAPSLIEIESANGRGDRLDAAALQPHEVSDQSPDPEALESSESTVLPTTEIGRGDRLDAAALQPHEVSDQSPDPEALDSSLSTVPPSIDLDPEPVPEVSLDDLCNALLTSAQENDLPVPFFANLIWQESRLRDDAVSPVGALGIAQFMPRVAEASGLDNPFDPLQAIPASARLLHALRDQFGNLGFVAAAYNAGARRVSEWLERRRALPRETRNYVVRVTGRSAEDWRTTPPDDAALAFVRHLPCRGLPAFADLEQAQLQEMQLEKTNAQLEKTELQQAEKADQPTASEHRGRELSADRRQRHTRDRRDAIHTAAAARRGGRHAKQLVHAAHGTRTHRKMREKSRLA
jgi:Transglycosylase SLT domain